MTQRSPIAARITTAALGTATFGVTSVALAVSGRTLPFPHPSSLSELSQWADRVGPTIAAFTAARAGAAMVSAWLVTTWALGVAVRILRLPRAIDASNALTLPSVRRLADLVAGATVVAVSLVPVSHAGAVAPDAAPLVVMRDLGPTDAEGPSPATTTTTTVPPAATTTTTTRPAGATQPTAPPTIAPEAGLPPPSPPGRDSEPLPATTAGTPGDTWVIRPGDTLWHVACTTASSRLGRPASPGEILAHLDRIVRLNAGRLVIPGDADLVFPGQEFALPTAP